MSAGEGALAGVRVVEFTDELGSYCGRLLADLGAEVIKVEPPGGGLERATPPFVHGDPAGSLAFWVHNTSKQSVVLDLAQAKNRRLVRQLALTADVLVEDDPPGQLASFGLGYDELSRERPALVYTSITGFGQDGPHAGFAYSDVVAQAMGGVMTLAGDPDDPPNLIYGNQANVSASIQAAQGTLLALLHAEATGEGQHVDVSAQEALSMSQETAMQTWDLQKRNRVRTGERGLLPIPLPGAAVYETSDGHLVCYVLLPGGADFTVLVDWMREKGMAADLHEEPYASLCAGLNMGFLTRVLGDPASVATVVPGLAHINEVLRAFFRSISAREAYEEGQRRRLLHGIVSTPADLAANAQLRAREWFVELPVNGGRVEFPGPPYRLSGTPVAIRRPPRLGEHTAAVLASLRKGTKR